MGEITPAQMQVRRRVAQIRMRMLRFLPPVTVGIAVLMLTIGLVLLVRTVRFLKTARSVDAVVIRVEERRSTADGGRTRSLYLPVFQLRDSSGAVREVSPSGSSSEYGYRVGSTVPVLYSESHQEVRVNSFFGVWFVTVLVCGIGLGWGIMAPMVVIGVRRQRAAFAVAEATTAASSPG